MPTSTNFQSKKYALVIVKLLLLLMLIVPTACYLDEATLEDKLILDNFVYDTGSFINAGTLQLPQGAVSVENAVTKGSFRDSSSILLFQHTVHTYDSSAAFNSGVALASWLDERRENSQAIEPSLAHPKLSSSECRLINTHRWFIHCIYFFEPTEFEVEYILVEISNRDESVVLADNERVHASINSYLTRR